jgi:hypothetical protein
MEEINTLDLIRRAQEGDEFAMNRLITIIRDEHMPGRIRNQRKRNVLVEEDDIESEFLMACFQAVKEAKLDLGNPLMYILWKGQLAVGYLFRKSIKKGVRVSCNTCGDSSLAMSRGRVLCGTCGSSEVQTHMVLVDENKVDDAEKESGPIWDKVEPEAVCSIVDKTWDATVHGIQVQELRSRLSGRTLQLFDIIAIEGINRDSSKNYLDEIAKRWGVTTACVSIYLRKLRKAVQAYYDQG